MSVRISPATPDDVPTILSFIRELAEYEKLLDRVTATEQLLRDTATPYTGSVDTTFGDCETGPLPTNGVGYGLLNAFAAVQAALAAR